MKHSQIRKFLRRGCSLLLTGALCMPSAVFASQGEPRIQTSHELLDGLTYINTVSEHTAGRTESFVLELEEDSKVFPILLQSSGTIYGTATINAAVKQAQDLGYQVLAAVNTDYFSTATGVPMGIVIEDGVYKSDAAGNPAMVIADSEVLLCEEPEVSLTLTNEENDVEVVPNYFNKYRASTGGVYLLNEYFSTVSTRTNSSGWFVRMEVVDYDPDDRDHQLTVNSELELEVTEVLQTSEAITINEGEYVLTADDVSNKLSVFESFQVGDRITLVTECEDDDLSNAQWAGGVGDTIVDKNKVTDPSGWTKVDYVDSVRAPRTALGVRRDGTLVLYTVDGRQSKHSVGLTMTDLANKMVEQDCKWAVNLDGGGSTTASVWLPG
ncbi:MAG: phosphodiester glycosidase family protein, partial [Clostridium sp.]|nr:phosphodiester glycosidase family protein [Clostridium sp.]